MEINKDNVHLFVDGVLIGCAVPAELAVCKSANYIEPELPANTEESLQKGKFYVWQQGEMQVFSSTEPFSEQTAKVLTEAFEEAATTGELVEMNIGNSPGKAALKITRAKNGYHASVVSYTWKGNGQST